MAIEQKGPGGVNASYGKRVTENSFDVTKTYDKDLYVSSSGDIVGPDGQPPGLDPSAVAAALYSLPPGTAVVANIVPRTGTLSALSPPNSPAGTAGEIAVATDAQAVVVLSGTAGDAQVLAPWGGYRVKNLNITSTWSTDDLTWPTDAGRLILRYPIAPATSATGDVVLTAGRVIGQSFAVYNSADGAQTYTVPVPGGTLTIGPGEVAVFEWVYSDADGPSVPAWVLRERYVLDNLNNGAVMPAGAAIRDGVMVPMPEAVGTLMVGGGAAFVGSPKHYVIGARNEAMPAYRSITSVTALTSATSATELTLDGAAGNALVNRLFVAPIGWQSMYRIEADVFARAGSSNNWFGRRWALVRVSSAGGITIVATGTDGTDQANGVTAPTALAFSSPTARALTLSVTPANTTATNWAAHITVTAVGV